MLRPLVLQSAKARWAERVGADGSPALLVDRVLDVQTDALCYIVGTIYVDMPLKPSILEDISQDTWVVPQPTRVKIFSEKDSILIEDESGRMELVGDIVKNAGLVTGVVIGVLGSETRDGTFRVVDLCYAQLHPQTPLPAIEEDLFIAFTSGLKFEPRTACSLESQLLVDLLSGEIGLESEQFRASKIVQLVIAGNTLIRTPLAEVKPGSKSEYINDQTVNVDLFLQTLVTSIPVVLMPGDTDPAGYSLPQQQMHKGMFQKSSQYPSLNLTTNPCAFDIAGVSCLGTSGQNIDDICRYIEEADRLALAERTVTWGHIAPTAPDTLWCYPFKDNDPFVLQTRPHIYFIGNQPKFETKLIMNSRNERTLVILIPAFADSKQLVLVNLRTLETSVASF